VSDLVLLGDDVERELALRDVASLVVRDLSTGLHHAREASVSLGLHSQLDDAVIDEDLVAHVEVLHHVRVLDLHALGRSEHAVGSHVDVIAHIHVEWLLDLARADLGALDVAEDRYLHLHNATVIQRKCEAGERASET
jgi:hypothetical protein